MIQPGNREQRDQGGRHRNKAEIKAGARAADIFRQLSFRESSGRTHRREDNNGGEYIELFRIWFFAVATKIEPAKGPDATVSYPCNPVL